MTQTVPDISPLMPMHQDPLLVDILIRCHGKKVLPSLLAKPNGDLPLKWPGVWSLYVSVLASAYKLLNKLSNFRWFDMAHLNTSNNTITQYRIYMNGNEFVTTYIWYKTVNTLKLYEKGCHIADDSFKYIFLNVNCFIFLPISMKRVPRSPFNKPSLVQIMAIRDKP